MNNKKKIIDILSWGSVILLVVALFLGSSCITVGTYMFTAIDNDKLTASTYTGNVEGVITEVSREQFYTVIEYTVSNDDESYTIDQNIDMYTDSYKVGDSVTVYYNDEHPEADFIVPELYVPYYTKAGKTLLYAGLIISLTAVIVVVAVRIIVKKLRMKGYSEY